MSYSKTISKNDLEACRVQFGWDDPAFGIISGQTPNQVVAHHAMVRAEMIIATPNLDFAALEKHFKIPTDISSIPTPGTTSFSKPQTATKPATIPAKRGRKGENVVKAFAAIPSTPVDVNQFAATQGVSLHVLRQSKRFDPNPALGKVRVAKDKATKTLMISRIKA